MKLYLIEQSERMDYDTFDSAVVAAMTSKGAQRIHPEESWGHANREELWEDAKTDNYGSWASKPENVTVKLIGDAIPGTAEGVILASFHAG